MAKKKGHGGGHGNSERWLLTYADMITLLTAFFIMMYSMSVVNVTKFKQVAISIRSGFGGTLNGGGMSLLNPAPGMGQKPAILPDANVLPEQKMAKQVRHYIEENKLQGHVRVKQTVRGLVVSMATDAAPGDSAPDGSPPDSQAKDKVLFPPGDASVTPGAAAVLEKLVSLLSDSKDHIRIEGHTDDLPIHTAQYPSNWELSTARAANVVRWLIEHEGFDASRLSAAGYADSRPLVPNDTDVHRAYNRRVDILILKADDSGAN